ncbi:5'-nucleotidase, lipoprotein e(P4) family [Clostridiaceae bacterium M8S5]|nr:5'-nucleotidase, lipoprotein e(P4) family [Clostridiaceae bacterium M8S5]
MKNKRSIGLIITIVMIVTLLSGFVSADSMYTVKAGDALWKIGKAVGVDYKNIAKHNNLKDLNKIYVGQELKIPTTETKAEIDIPTPGEKAPIEIPKTPEYTTKDLNEQLVMATLWMQKSSEFRALSYQAFNMAKLTIDNKLSNATKSPKYAKKQAIVVDADETVIDNTPYQAYLIGNNFGYSSSTWNKWVDAQKAQAMPGAKEFLSYCKEKGVEVFYITNRKMVGYQATVNNLKELGFPNVDEKHMLLRTDSSDKEERRKKVKDEYNILLYMGDNLNDFSSEFGKKTVEERFSVTDSNKDKFGIDWIVLPNPTYGEWDGAIINYNWGIKAPEKDKTRKDSLNKWVPSN